MVDNNPPRIPVSNLASFPILVTTREFFGLILIPAHAKGRPPSADAV
jgi:hypothetical protein